MVFVCNYSEGPGIRLPALALAQGPLYLIGLAQS